MKRIKAALGYRILLLFATISKKYEVHQGALMLKFVEKISGIGTDIDIEHQNDLLLGKNTKDLIKSFLRWLNIFDRLSTKEEKAHLMYFAYQIVGHDNNIDTAERQLFRKTGMVLGMPSDEMLRAFSF